MKNESNQGQQKTEESIHVCVSMVKIKNAFTEWERRYREDPEKFQSEASKLLTETPKTYGDACAPYFVKLLYEID